MVRDFASLGEAKKRSSVYVKAVSLLCAAIVALVLFFMNMTVRGVTDRILVVNTGGEFLQLKSMETDKLYETLLKAHCNAVAYYVNSFDRMSISGNQAQAVFLVEKSELNAIWNKYLNDRAYAQLADATGINRALISRIEQKDFVPSIEQLESLSEVLNFDLTDMFIFPTSDINDITPLSPPIIMIKNNRMNPSIINISSSPFLSLISLSQM